jgi:hypothetical protein
LFGADSANESIYANSKIVIPRGMNFLENGAPGKFRPSPGEVTENQTLQTVHRKGDISQTENVAMTISRLAEKPPGGLPYLIVRPIP